jgi:hypothetical protein
MACAFGRFDLMGRRRIRTAEYWREYYTRKQREWRAAHPRIRTQREHKQRDKGRMREDLADRPKV